MYFKLNYRKVALIFADICIFALSSLLSHFFMTIFNIQLALDRDILLFIILSIAFGFFCLFILGAYSKMWRYFKPKDYLSCLFGVVSGYVTTTFIYNCFNPLTKELLIFIGINTVISTLGIMLFRLIFRKVFLTIIKAEKSVHNERIMIIGAGQASRLIIQEIKNNKYDPNSPGYNLLPVCIVDDDPTKLHNRIDGVEIKGTTANIQKLCVEESIDRIVFAIPSATDEERKKILNICSETECQISILPYLSQLMFTDNNPNLLNQIKEIRVEDLLGRESIKFDTNAIEKFINNKVCLITGAGGSIGSELVRQIASYKPKQMVLVDIYENSVYEIQQELVMNYSNTLNHITLIASVRDYDKMECIFKKYKPEIVFHAAAHKHVPLMEVSPAEAVKNNIFGTYNVAKLANEYGVKKFIMISTDKAVNPTNVMGATKRCCEMIVQYMSQNTNTTEFVTTRFGNVLGSNGSVIPLFKKQIESGLPVTVTHPDIIRYFMTIPEAVSLVLEAGAIANGGEIFVLDMGDPVKITTLAENLIRMYGKIPYKDVKIVFSGLRPGEKLFEELLMDEEGLTSTCNKKIFVGNQIKIDPKEFTGKLEHLREVSSTNNEEETVNILSDIVPTFKRKVE